MMVSLMTIEAGEHLVLECVPDAVRNNERRMVKTATLDGGSVIVNSGVSESDRDLSFSAKNVALAERDLLWRLFNDEALIHMACSEGVFSGLLREASIDDYAGTADLTFSVFQKLT